MNHPDITHTELTGYGPGSVPELIGDCQACGGEMYAYELEVCECGREVHKGCLVTCFVCRHKGCKGCMIQDEATGEIICGQDCQEKLKGE